MNLERRIIKEKLLDVLPGWISGLLERNYTHVISHISKNFWFDKIFDAVQDKRYELLNARAVANLILLDFIAVIYEMSHPYDYSEIIREAHDEILSDSELTREVYDEILSEVENIIRHDKDFHNAVRDFAARVIADVQTALHNLYATRK